MASDLVLHLEGLSFLAGQLSDARFFGVEMVNSRGSAQNFTRLGDLQSFCV